MGQLRLLAPVCALAAAACSGGAPFDEKQMFETTYSNPVIVSIPTAQPLVSPADNIDTKCVFAKLVDNKALGYAPEPSAAPWIRVASSTLTLDQNSAVVLSGRRVWDSSSNKNRYQRDGNDYFASDVTYYVQGNSPLPAPDSRGYGPFQARIIYVNDPAVGHWAASTQLNDNVVSTILANMSQGACPQQVVEQSAAAARVAAMDAIEKQLADNGAIKATPDKQILISPASRIAVFKGWANENKLDGVPAEALTATAKQMCANLRRGSYRWQLPTYQDFYRFTSYYVRGDFRVLLDTPDKRLWGDVQPEPPSTVSDYFVVDSNQPPYNLYEAIYRSDGILVYDTVSFSNGHKRLMCIANL